MKKVLIMPWILALILFCSTIKVKADTQTSGMWQAYYQNQDKTNEYSYNNNYARAQLTNNSNNITIFNYWFGTNITKNSNTDYILIPIMILGETFSQGDNITKDWECKEWLQTDFNSNGNYNGYECKWWAYETDHELYRSDVQFKMVVKLRAPNQSDAFCTLDSNYAKCYLKENTTYQGIQIEYNYSLSNYTSLYLGINRGISFYKDGVTSVTDSINNQTQQQQQNYNNMMNETRTYDNNINTNQNGANETMQWGQQEEALMNQLDMNTTMLSDININADAAGFIWDVVGGLRNMNPAIVMLFTSLLGLGVARMLLNR